jgi:hypothetical protein
MLTQKSKRLSAWMHPSDGFLIVVVVLLSILILSYSVHRWFDHDEFEHVHSTWYVAHGYVPYSDFFQLHHPLLWYSMAPLLTALGYSARSVVVLRVVMFGLTMGIASLTYLIARAVTSSRKTGLLSVALLLSMVMFVEKSVEIRPDVPQVLLGLVSVYFLVRFMDTKDNRDMVFAGLSAAISFLFLQKSVWLLLAYAAMFCYGLLRRRTTVRSVLCFAVPFSIPIVLFCGWLLISGSFDDYVLTNWMLHLHWIQRFSPFGYLRNSFVTQNALFWMLSAVSAGFVLLSRKTDERLKVVTFIGTVLLFSVLLARAPSRQYYLFPIPLLSISAGSFTERLFDRFRLTELHKVLVVILILAQPVLSLAPEATRARRRDGQLGRVDYVLRHTAESDLVYDGNIQFNLYRHDVHYFWFCIAQNQGLGTYNKVTNDSYGDYDLCELIASQQPKFISDYDLDLVECGPRAELYGDTPFAGLYVRGEPQDYQQPLWRNLGDSVALLGYDVELVRREDGDHLRVSLWWKALADMDRDYTAFVHLLEPDDRIWAQDDRMVKIGERPTSTWRVGETVRQEYDLPVPPSALPDEYTIKAGLYYWATGERLPAWDEHGQRLADDAIPLPQEDSP